VAVPIGRSPCPVSVPSFYSDAMISEIRIARPLDLYHITYVMLYVVRGVCRVVSIL
jgi:hypothetical protein